MFISLTHSVGVFLFLSLPLSTLQSPLLTPPACVLSVLLSVPLICSDVTGVTGVGIRADLLAAGLVALT